MPDDHKRESRGDIKDHERALKNIYASLFGLTNLSSYIYVTIKNTVMNFEKMKEMVDLQLQANVEHMDNGEPSEETMAKIEAVAQELTLEEHLVIVKTLEEVFGKVEVVGVES